MSQISINRAKLTNDRIILTGSILEIYHFQKPFVYNRNVEPGLDSNSGNFSNKRDDNLTRAQSKLRRLVNANANIFGYLPVFVTYTFREEITDYKVAVILFKKHLRQLKEQTVGRSLRYLAVPEIQPQRLQRTGKSVWHFHVIFFDLPYIQGLKFLLTESWPHGFTKINALYNVKNIGAYVSKYFSKEWGKKRPKFMKSYFTSNLLKQPEIFYTVKALAEKIGSCKIINEFERSYQTKLGLTTYTQYKLQKNDIS